MRILAAATLSLALLPLGASFAADAASAPAAAASSDAAAARHAKRIACRKEATGKKLIGDDKRDYIKACIAKP